MGSCVSGQKVSPEEAKKRREAKIRSKWIEDQLNQDQKTDTEAIKLLFLGAGESGKSTMLKQMKIIHAKENEEAFSLEDRQSYIPLIHSNVIQSTKTLLKGSDVLHKHERPTRISPQNEDARRVVEELKFDDVLSPQLVDIIKRLWSDPGIRATYEQKSSLQLSDSTAYFYERIDEMIRNHYLPTNQDILRARIRTTGIVEHTFLIKENEFRMYDVGGQRNARKKWIHCFENVTSVIFVAALSDYDQKLYEDNTTNRMVEALNLFEDILSSKWFERTSMILFLNKKDIFKEKVKATPITVCFKEYDGPQEYVACCQYIREKFKERNHNHERKIYTHFTVATDTDAFKKVFQSVQQIILRLHLIDVGLMDPSTDIGEEDSHEIHEELLN